MLAPALDLITSLGGDFVTTGIVQNFWGFASSNALKSLPTGQLQINGGWEGSKRPTIHNIRFLNDTGPPGRTNRDCLPSNLFPRQPYPTKRNDQSLTIRSHNTCHSVAHCTEVMGP